MRIPHVTVLAAVGILLLGLGIALAAAAEEASANFPGGVSPPGLQEPLPESDRDCTCTLTPNIPTETYAGWLTDCRMEFTFAGDCTGVNFWWWPTSKSFDSRQIYRMKYWTQDWKDPGNYTWKIYAGDYYNRRCEASGTITVLPSPCTLSCTATVPDTAQPNTDVTFAATVTPDQCPDAYVGGYSWDFGDGGGSTGPSPTHRYTTEGTYHWKFRAYDTFPTVECVREGDIEIGGATGGCDRLGGSRLLEHQICYDTKTQQGDTTTYSGHVDIDKALFFTESISLQGTAVPFLGTLSTNGDVYTPMGPFARVNFFMGPGLAFSASLDRLVLPPTIRPAFWFLMSDIVMYNGLPDLGVESPITLAGDTVIAQPVLYVGDPTMVALAAIKPTLTFWPDQKLELTAADLVWGKFKAGIEVTGGRNFRYSYSQPQLSGQLALGFPHVEPSETIWTDMVVENGCVNSLDLVPGSPPAVSIGGWLLAGFDLSVLNLCEPDVYAVLMGKNLTSQSLSYNLFSVYPASLLYETPQVWTLMPGSQPVFLGYGLSGATGKLFHFNDFFIFDGGLTIPWSTGGNILRGQLTGAIYDPTRATGKKNAQGWLEGTIWLNRYPCAGGDKKCQDVRDLLLGMYGAGAAFPDMVFDVAAKAFTGDRYEGTLRSRTQIAGKLSAAVSVAGQALAQPAVSVNLARNAASLPLGRSARPVGPAAAEQTVSLGGGEGWVILGARGLSGTLPSLYLVTPEGQTVTPENYPAFPGTAYGADPETAFAGYTVDAPSAGNWTVGVGNLPEADLSFTALVPVPPTATLFSAANRSGNLVDISLAVSPPSEQTTVDLYYSRSRDGVPEGVIAEGLPASSGIVSAQWDLSPLPSSTYFLFAVTDDGANAPATTYYDGSFAVDSGTLAAPADLTGTRSPDSATLSWTPSASPGAGGYTVLYTDSPSTAGYPLSKPTPYSNTATVQGLDPLQSYRFTVQAYDGLGNLSPESNTWTAPAIPPVKPGDCDGNGTVSIGEVQKAINMFLGTLAPGCGVDCNGSGTVSIGEVQKAINGFLGLASTC